MELLQLRYFIDAATNQNFSATARKYLVPPSSVSQSIKRLEEELGAALFVRTSNKVTLSAAGKHFLQEAQTALQILDNAKKAVKTGHTETAIRIHVHMHRQLTTNVISQFYKLHPEINFITTYGRLGDAQCDIIVTYMDKHYPGMTKTPVAQEHFALAYHKDHFHIPEKITAADIQGKPFVTYGQEQASLLGYTMMFCQSLGIEPYIAVKTEDPYYMRQCIERGEMIAVIPRLSWHGLFSDNIILQPLNLTPRTTYIYAKNDATPLQKAFFQILSKELRTLSDALSE